MDAIKTIITTLSTNFSTCAKNNMILIAVAVYLLIIFFYMTNDPDVLYSKQYFYLSIILIPLVAVGIWFYKTNGAAISGNQTIFAATMLGLVVVGISLYISNDISILEIKSAFTIFRILEVLIVLVILAIVLTEEE